MAMQLRWMMVFFVFLLFFPSLLSAQTGPRPEMEWGTIPDAQKALSRCPFDSSASAVVLFDLGEEFLNNNLCFEQYRHCRIKIFSPSGYSAGTVKAVLFTAGGSNVMKKIEGITHVPGADGTLTPTELSDDAIFEQPIDRSHTAYSFTLPALAPGCIIEFRYHIVTHSFFAPLGWTFQTTIPTLWSEFGFTTPNKLSYVALSRGYERYYGTNESIVDLNFSGEAAGYLGSRIAHCYRLWWALRNAPAVKEEPFMSDPENYVQHIDLQLKEYARGDGTVGHESRSWDQVLETLLDEKDCGKAPEATKEVRRAVTACLAGAQTREEKIRAIYDDIRRRITSTESDAWWMTTSPDEVLEKRVGRQSDIVYLFLSMLKAADIEAYPVLLSARAYRGIERVYPVLDQLEGVLAAIPEANGGYRYYAPTSRYRGPNLLPSSVLHLRGLIVRPGTPQWVEIGPAVAATRQVAATCSLSVAGELTGLAHVTLTGYEGIADRVRLEKQSPSEIFRARVATTPAGLETDSAQVEGKDSLDLPLRFSAHVTGSGYAQGDETMLHFSPFPVGRLFENPLRLPTRTFPVEMQYPTTSAVHLRIQLPPGYDVEELPAPVRRGFGSHASYIQTCEVHDGVLTVADSLQFFTIEFPASQYAGLKAFYADITASQAQQVVLRKHPAPVAAPSIKEAHSPSSATTHRTASKGKKK